MPFSSSDDEARWVKKLKSDDSHALEFLFKEYCQPLINFSRRIVIETETAENIVQDVFLKVWENRKSLKLGTSIKSYLFTITRNESLKYQRHQTVVRESDEAVRDLHSSVETPDEQFNQSEIESHIHKAINLLPDKRRKIFMMNRFDDLTYREIAEVLNISIKTVETQMGRALKHLRENLSFLK